MSLSQSLLLLFASFSLITARYLLGVGFSRVFCLNLRGGVNLLILGWGLELFLLYIPERASIPNVLGISVMALFFFAGMLGSLRSEAALSARATFRLIFMLAPTLIIVYSPSILNKFVMYQNWGPDLDGNLISTGYITNGGSFVDLVHKYTHSLGRTDWWNSDRASPWMLADQRDGISIEFFLRSMRWGHALEGRLINKIFSEDVWFGLLVLMVSSSIIINQQIYRWSLENGIDDKSAVLIATISSCSPALIMMFYEGVNVQMIYTPVYLILLHSFTCLLRGSASSLIVMAAAIEILSISFGEGLQLALFVLVVCAFFSFKSLNLILPVSLAFKRILFFCFLFFIPLSDFLTWTIIRLKDGMEGGALHYDFNPILIILQAPYLIIRRIVGHDAIREIIPMGNTGAVSLLLIATFVVSFLTYKERSAKNILIAGSFAACLAVSLTGHRYALWKICTLSSPIVFPWFVQMTFRNSVLRRSYLLISLSVAFIAMIYNIKNYSIISEPVTVGQFKPQGIPSGCYALITPSTLRGYFRMAASGDFKWLNSGFRQFGFPIKLDPKVEGSCPIYYYSNCDTERAGCDESDATHGVHENELVDSGLIISDVINSEGFLAISKDEIIWRMKLN